MEEQNPHHMINQLHNEQDSAVVKTIYNNWAAHYDQDLDELGYLGPQMGAQLLINHLANREALVLDAGCGTGLVGHWLYAFGYHQLHGTDYSEAMLAVANKRKIYQKLFQTDFQDVLPASLTAVYDALICIGVMGPRVRVTILNDFARLVKPGGLLCISMRVAWYEAHGAKQQIESMLANQTIEQVALYHKPYMDGQQADALYSILRIL